MQKVLSLFNASIPFQAIAFPGGYKLVAIFSIPYFFSDEIAAYFSKGFFWGALSLSLVGVPISAVMSSRKYFVSDFQKYALVVLFSSVLFIPFCVFFANKFGFLYVLDVFFASVFVSIYEVVKKDFFNSERFFLVWVCGVISFFILGVFLFFYSFDFYISVVISLMVFPIWLCHVFMRSEGSVEYLSFGKLLRMYLNYAVSNVCSTSLGSIVSLYLISELGDKVAEIIAKIYSASQFLMFIPRAISARNIPVLRNKGIDKRVVYSYFRKIVLYVLVVSFFALILISMNFDSNEYVYMSLLLGLQLGQLSLPFSNVLAVEGMAKELMVVNFKCSSVLYLTMLFDFLFDFYFGLYAVLVVYLLHYLLRFYLTRKSALLYF